MIKINDKNVFILGINSDIGYEITLRYLRDGFNVLGTYRNENQNNYILRESGISLIHCDISKFESINLAVNQFNSLNIKWDIFISCIGDMNPIRKFFECDFDDWEKSIAVNSISQLRFLHEVHSMRNPNSISNVIFMAGGGTNNPFTNYSAYCVSKIFLMKMCELLDDENADMNVCIIGPGFVKTRIHEQTIANKESAGDNYEKTKKLLEIEFQGTSFDDIYECIKWCINNGKQIVGGRNLSVVHDKWRDGGEELFFELKNDNNKFKLRRSGNSD